VAKHYAETKVTLEEIRAYYEQYPQYKTTLARLVPITIFKDKAFKAGNSFRRGTHTWGYIRSESEEAAERPQDRTPYVACMKYRKWFQSSNPDEITFSFCASSTPFFREGHI
jgi:hypothetical protein